jgi:hypothetical protein
MKTEFFSKKWTRSIAHSLAALAIISTGVVYNPVDSHAQGRNEIEQILKRFKNYRYGNITVYRLENPNLASVRNILKTDSKTESTGEDPMTKLEPAMQVQVRQAVQQNRSEVRAIRALQGRGIVITPDIESAVRSEVEKLNSGSGPRIEDVYIITTRVPRGEVGTIIALIATTKGNSDIEKNLNVVTDSDILTIDELRAYPLAATYGADNLYDYINTAIVQGAVKNVTADAQGLTNIFNQFVPREYGLTASVIADETNVTDADIQQFIRISEGQPSSYYYPNEVIVSYDLISYRRYMPDYLSYYAEEAPADAATAGAADTTGGADAAPAEEEQAPTDVYNVELPKYGVELRYGMDEINYPSLWSERVALNAIWQNAKLGVILPTSGWASLAESFGQERRLTHAGFGVNGAFNFPVKIIPSSGIFHANFAYVFDDAVESSYKTHRKDPFGDFDSVGNDYLVRFNAQLHYTFAIAVDKDYMFRFGIGGSVYNVESWYNRLNVTTDENGAERREAVFTERENETIGGISGRIEYMTVNTPTPYGFGLQYFDEAISGNIWLQIPFSTQVAVRLEGKAFAPAFRDPHPWENSNVFIPSARLIWNF